MRRLVLLALCLLPLVLLGLTSGMRPAGALGVTSISPAAVSVFTAHQSATLGFQGDAGVAGYSDVSIAANDSGFNPLILTAANSQIRLSQPDGDSVAQTTLQQLFGVAADQVVYGAKVTYSVARQRFVVVATHIDRGATKVSRVLIAVSNNSTPTGFAAGWRTGAFDTGLPVGMAFTQFAEVAGIGFDGTNLNVTFDTFNYDPPTTSPNSFTGNRLARFSWANLTSGAAIAAPSFVENIPVNAALGAGPAFHLVPVEGDGASLLVSAGVPAGFPGATNRSGLSVYDIGTATTLFIDTSDWSSPGNASEQFFDQVRVRDSLGKVVARNGRFYTAHTVRDSSGTKQAVRMYSIGSPVDVREAQFEDDTDGFYFPSVAPDTRGNVTLVFQGSSSNTPHSIYHARWLSGGAGVAETPRLAFTSNYNYQVGTGSGFQAWGRVTDAVLDPTDNQFVYTHATLAHETNVWRSVVQKVPNRNMVVLAPNGGEVYKLAGPGDVPPAQTIDICWPPGNADASTNQRIRIWLARDGVNFSEVLTTGPGSSTEDDGLFQWTVTGPVTLQAKIRIAIVTNGGTPLAAFTDESDATFTITNPNETTNSVTLNPPVPIPDNWQSNADWVESELFLPKDLTIQGISVSATLTHPYPPDLEVYLVHPDGTSVVLHDQGGVPQVGAVQPWINRTTTYPVPTPPGEGTQSFLNKLLLKRSRLWTPEGQELPWKLRVRDLNPTSVGTLNGWSLTVFGPSTVRLKVTHPNGGERLESGTQSQVTWTNDVNNPVQGNVNVILDRDGNFSTLGDQTALGTVPVDTGVLAFAVPDEVSPVSTYRVRVANVVDAEQFDDSDAPFEIRRRFVQVTYPNAGGVEFFTGQQYAITWDRLPTNQNVNIELTRNSSAMSPTYETLATNASGTSFNWVATGPDTTDARIRITSASDGTLVDSSDNAFRITTKQITVTGPTGIADVDANHPVTWTSAGLTGNVVIELTRNADAATPTWELIAPSVNVAAGTTNWVVTGPPTQHAKIRITSVNEPSISDVGDEFVIRQGTITVTSPTSVERLAVGKQFVITWDSTEPLIGNPGSVIIEIRRGLNAWEFIANTPNDGSYTWTNVTGPPNPVNQSSEIRVRSIQYPSTVGVSAPFKVVSPSVRVLQPNGGEGLGINQTYTITWEAFPLDSALNPSDVDIALSRDNGTTWEPIVSGTDNDGQYNWNVTGPATAQALVRISVVGGVFPTETDVSNSVFRIDTQQIQVSQPQAGEKLYVGTTKTINWSAVGVPGTVRIEVHRGAAVETLATNVPVGQGSFIWNPVTGPHTGAVVRVVSEADPAVFGASNAFDILNFGLSITSPTGNPNWGKGIARKIRWTFSSGFTGSADVFVAFNGQPEILIGSAAAPGGNGTLDWTPDGEVGPATIKVRVPNTDPVQEATASVTIVEPAITVSAPAANAELRVGQQTTIIWSSAGLQQEDQSNGTVNISLSRNGGPFQALPGLQGIPNTGSANWTPTGPDSTDVRIRVTSVEVGVFGDSGQFKITTPSLVVTKPVGGASFIIGDQTTIEWTATGITGPLIIEIQRNGGAWETLFNGVSAAAGSQAWTVTGDGSGNGSASNRIRIRSANPVDTAEGLNPGSFAIVKPSITVGTPNGGQNYLAGSIQSITWSSTGIPAGDNVMIQLVKGGAVVQTLAASTPNDGLHSWTVTNTPGGDYRIRITRSGSQAAADESDSNFAVVAPTLTVSSPNGGETVRKNRVVAINWSGSVLSAQGGGGTVNVYLSRDGGATYSLIIANTANDGSVNWKATGKATKKARIKVEWVPSPGVSDASNGNFKIK